MSAETDSNKIEHKEHFHGSDLEKIEKIYGIVILRVPEY